MEGRNGIDIIIPVYNALDDLKLCIESIKKHTDLTLDRLILIDDKSPDQNVFPYLKTVEEPGIVVLQNEENQGFSGTINRGLGYSDRDVILLNSDTIVTARWTDKLVAGAYSDPAIATVTPFSNNATLCSIPNFCEENSVPLGMSIDEYASIIEHCSMKKYPRITVAVGFCMYIKREVINCTGLFDKETFQRGYGEENDFCWRASQLGYYHVLCDDTYIYHSGSMSFLSEEKKKLIAEHEQILQKWYPKQNHENAVYVRDNPHQYLRDNVGIYESLRNGKKNILYVLHMDFRADSNNNIGGTQLHVKDLMVNLRKNHNIFVMARDREYIRLTAYLEKREVSFKFSLGIQNDFQIFTNKKISEIYSNILKAFSIDAVHVHHVMGLSFDIFRLTKENGIPLLLTLHDYYYICPNTKLLEGGTRYCAGCGADCAACLHQELGYVEKLSYLPIWQKKCREVLNLCDILITPSQASKEVYKKIYPEIAERINVIPHGMDRNGDEIHTFAEGVTPGFSCNLERAFSDDYTISGWAIQECVDSQTSEVVLHIEDSQGTYGEFHALPVNRPDLAESKGSNLYLNGGFTVQIPDAYFASGDLRVQLYIHHCGEQYHSQIMIVSGYIRREKSRKRIAFLGGLNAAKGSQIAYHLIKQSGNKYDWYIIGGLGDPNLMTLEKNNVYKTGWYKRENVSNLLRQNQIDLVCILPIWPETFCYTISEAQLSGVPILATDMGALGERLRVDNTGWLINSTMEVKDILKTIDGIFSDVQSYSQVKKNTEIFIHKSIAEMCEEYHTLYQALPEKKLHGAEFDAESIYEAYVLQNNSDAQLASTELIQRVHALESTLMSIEQSMEYRMVKFFNRENIPFKRQIKWLIGFVYRIYMKYLKK